MKTLEELKIELELLKPVLKEKFQVETIGIFGSYSQGQQKKKSDVDILVTFTKPNDIDLRFYCSKTIFKPEIENKS